MSTTLRNAAPATQARADELPAAGWTIIDGCDWNLPDRPKYLAMHVLRIRQTNDRCHGRCLATTYAVRPATVGGSIVTEAIVQVCGRDSRGVALYDWRVVTDDGTERVGGLNVLDRSQARRELAASFDSIETAAVRS